MKPEVKMRIFYQLEEKGYIFKNYNNNYLANHSVKIPFFVYDFGKGLLFYERYDKSEYTHKNRLEYLDYINRLNHKAKIAKFTDFRNEMLGQLWIYVGLNKGEFSTILKIWENDISLMPFTLKGFEKMFATED